MMAKEALQITEHLFGYLKAIKSENKDNSFIVNFSDDELKAWKMIIDIAKNNIEKG